jgi:hypothetical protein
MGRDFEKELDTGYGASGVQLSAFESYRFAKKTDDRSEAFLLSCITCPLSNVIGNIKKSQKGWP